jgi:hypothetical protein
VCHSLSSPAPAMEPPTKRLRILKSLDVDEDNAEYIRKKREAEAQLKNQFESIFAKYENMTEDMSDEIDMVKGTVVVDRGHLRSLQDKPNAMRAADFLEDLLVGGGPGGVIDGYDEDEIDELAPPEPPKKKSIRKGDDGVHANNQVAFISPAIPASAPVSIPILPEVADTPVHANLMQVPQTPASLMQLAQLPPTPASLTHLAQLAPTPENQLVQNNFLAAFSQTMVQAVHQAFSIATLMGNSPSLNIHNTPFIPSAVMPATVDKVVPATNPKWYFPPLPEKQFAPRAVLSSPIPASDTVRKRKRPFAGNTRKGPIKRKATNNTLKIAPIAAPKRSIGPESAQVEMDPSNAVVSQPDTRSQLPNINGRSNSIYVFSREDDAYIIEQKKHKDRSWSDIKDGQPAWKYWPLSAIQNRYLNHLKGRVRDDGNTIESSEHIAEDAACRNEPHEREDLEAEVNISTPSSEANMLPKRRKNGACTFNSEDDRYIVEQRNTHNLSWAEIKDGRAEWQDLPLSAIHNHWYNDLRNRVEDFKGTSIVEKDETEDVDGESRSLEQDQMGAQIEKEPISEESEAQTHKTLSSRSQRQLLMPSSLQHPGSSDMQKDAKIVTYETAALCVEFDEEDLQLTIAESQDIGSPPPEETVFQSIETDIVMEEEEDSKSGFYTSSLVEEQIQSPQRSASVVEKAISKFNNLESSPFRFVRRSKPTTKENSSFQADSDSDADDFNPIDTGSSPRKVPLPHTLPRTTKTTMALPSNLDESDSDELQSSPAMTKTITIKREPCTPRSSLFANTFFKTPNSAPQPTVTKSTAKLSRKEILKVQHSWTKKGRRGSPAPKQSHALKKRASLLSLHGKRAWEAGSVEDSDDELAK